MEWLKGMRDKKGMSQEEVARATEMKRASYSNIENGRRAPSVKAAKRIAAVLGFEWTKFFEDKSRSA